MPIRSSTARLSPPSSAWMACRARTASGCAAPGAVTDSTRTASNQPCASSMRWVSRRLGRVPRNRHTANWRVFEVAMTLSPRLVVGQVMHRRLRPAVHEFIYPVFCFQLPLSDLESGNRPIFSVNRDNLLSFRRTDHGPRDGSPLLPWIRTLLRQRGLADDGEVVLQCFPRVLGFVFNPVSFWYCHNAGGELIAVLAEVSNTFGGHHSYLLRHPDGTAVRDGQTLPRARCSMFRRSARSGASIAFASSCNAESGRTHRLRRGRGDLLHTSVSGWSHPGQLRRSCARCCACLSSQPGWYCRIHWQALRLWLKGVPFVGSAPRRPPPQSSRDRQLHRR